MESPPSSPLRRRNSAADYLTEIWAFLRARERLQKKPALVAARLSERPVAFRFMLTKT
jgi:hypothetical protein